MSLHTCNTPLCVMGSECMSIYYSPLSSACICAVPLQSMFTQGSVMILQSVASGSKLSIDDGEVSGKGIRNSYCKWAVVNNHNFIRPLQLDSLCLGLS